MASNSNNVEMLYMNSENAPKSIIRQESRIYDTLQYSQVELERNKTSSRRDHTSGFVLVCKKRVQSILIGLLYAIVLLCIVYYVYSEGDRNRNGKYLLDIIVIYTCTLFISAL